jgi:RNA polymerase sigma-70 factor (ECF subfamily)
MNSPEGYLFQVARNLLRRHRVASSAVRALRDISESSGPSHDQEKHAITRVDVLRALGQLRPNAREALVLHDWFGVDYDDCARLLRIPAGSVRVRVHRARLALRQELEEKDG